MPEEMGAQMYLRIDAHMSSKALWNTRGWEGDAGKGRPAGRETGRRGGNIDRSRRHPLLEKETFEKLQRNDVVETRHDLPA